MGGSGRMAVQKRGAAPSRTWLLAAVAAALANCALAERLPFSRYQPIIDRQMFGPLPVGFDSTKLPSEVSKSGAAAAEKELTKEQEKLKSAVKFSVINVTPEGETAIGFTDNSDPKKPVHYYLKVGESRGGWEVKEADANAATMTVVKDGIEVSLSLGGDSSKGAGKTEAAAQPQPPATERSSLLGGIRGASLGAQRRARREQEAAEDKAREEARAKREAELARREEERAQREAEIAARREADLEETRKTLQQLKEALQKSREQNQGPKDGEAIDNSAEK